MKAKGKVKQHVHKIPDRLDFVKRFEFDLPCSIDEYSDYLRSFEAGQFSRYHIYLSSIDQKQIQFHICKSAYVGSVWAIGCLQATGENTSDIVGKTGVFILVADVLLSILLVVGVAVLFVCSNYSLHDLAGSIICLFPVLFLLSLAIRISWELTRESLIDDLYLNLFKWEKTRRITDNETEINRI